MIRNIVSTSYKRGNIKYKLFGFTVYRRKNISFPEINIRDKNQVFDTSDVDLKIQKFICDYVSDNDIIFAKPAPMPQRIAFLATNLYDVGGHTECLKNTVEALREDYTMGVFLSQLNVVKKKSNIKLEQIKEAVSLFDGVSFRGVDFCKKAIDLFNVINDFQPKALIVYMHMDDSLSTAVLALIKKYTDTKVLYFNHGSHFPALGYSFSDASLECMPSTEIFTRQKRNFSKTILAGLPAGGKSDTPPYSDQEKQTKRDQMGVKTGNVCTISGGASYKLFNDSESPYFSFIKSLLMANTNLQHIVITNLDADQKNIVNSIFKDYPEGKKRLIFEPLTIDYEIIFSAADVFIDSFPIGAALTQIDLMRLKVPSVVKINTDNTKYSFHEYMPKNYAYMSDDLDKLRQHILYLLDNAEARKTLVEEHYKYYLNTYEAAATRRKYKHILENINDIDSLLT